MGEQCRGSNRKTVTKGLQAVLDDLNLFPDRADRIQALIDIADSFKNTTLTAPYPEEKRVPGCESEAFGFTTLDDQQRLVVNFAVLNPQGISAMAMAKILQEALNGEPPEVAQLIDPEIVYTIFGRELSMGKSGGLTNMVMLVRAQAAKLA